MENDVTKKIAQLEENKDVVGLEKIKNDPEKSFHGEMVELVEQAIARLNTKIEEITPVVEITENQKTQVESLGGKENELREVTSFFDNKIYEKDEEIRKIFYGFRRKVERFIRKVTNTDIDAKLKEKILTPENQYIGNQEKILANSPLEERKRFLGRAREGMALVKLEEDGFGIFKPYEGHATVDRKRQIQNERAAYVIDQSLGLDLVPPTVIRTFPDPSGIGEQIGSLQQFIEDAKTGEELADQEKQSVSEENVTKLALFDFMTQNNDRNDGNYIVTKKNFYAIDHGNCFTLPDQCKDIPKYILSDYENNITLKGPHSIEIEEFWTKIIPTETQTRLKKFKNSKEDQISLLAQLTELIGKEKADLYIDRILCVITSIQDDGRLDREIFKKSLNDQLVAQRSSRKE